MINRKEYLEKLLAWKDEPVIKVITGIRRSGKSTLLSLFKDWLLANNIQENQIISINFEDLAFENLCDYKLLYEYIINKLESNQKYYILLDEIQRVDSFEKAINSLQLKENIDIYLTGSNAFILSGELATYLSGRYIEISILPFSFAEYTELNPNENKEIVFNEYLKVGGFPYIATIDKTNEKITMYLEGIYNTIILKDIEERQKRRESDPTKRKVTDIALLKNIAKFLAHSIGNPISIKSISDYINSSGRKVSQNTIVDYLEVMTDSFIFYPVDRFDIQGKQLMKTSPKYYIVDLGIRNYLITKKEYDLGFCLENIVFLELLRRGYKINIGKLETLEVDFICQKNSLLQYIQVTASMADEKTFLREITPLKNIKDNYPKMILTLDQYSIGNYDGIEVVNIIDWLLQK